MAITTKLLVKNENNNKWEMVGYIEQFEPTRSPEVVMPCKPLLRCVLYHRPFSHIENIIKGGKNTTNKRKYALMQNGLSKWYRFNGKLKIIEIDGRGFCEIEVSITKVKGWVDISKNVAES